DYPGPATAALVCLAFASAVFFFVQYVNSWPGRALPEATAMAIVMEEVQAHPARQHLLVCADSRSPDALAFYFGYKYPPNLKVMAAGDLSEGSLQSSPRRFVFVNHQRSAFLGAAYGKERSDGEIEALGLRPAYALGPIQLFLADGEELRPFARLGISGEGS